MKRLISIFLIFTIALSPIFHIREAQANPAVSVLLRAVQQIIKKSFTKAGYSSNAAAIGNAQVRVNNLMNSTYQVGKGASPSGPFLSFYNGAKNLSWLGIQTTAWIYGPVIAWLFGERVGDKLFQIMPNFDGTFTINREEQQELLAIKPGSLFWRLSVNVPSPNSNAWVPFSTSILNDIALSTAQHRNLNLGDCSVIQQTQTRSTYNCVMYNRNGTINSNNFYIAEHFNNQTATFTCPPGEFYKDNQCFLSDIYLTVDNEIVSTTYSSIDTAIDSLTEEEKQLPITNDTLANIASQIVGHLEENDPLFPPLPTPITPELVGEAMEGVHYPTVGDLSSPWDTAPPYSPPYAPPIPAPFPGVGGGSIPSNPTIPEQTYEPGETAPPSAVEVDLGPDPGISINDMEDIPTGKKILEPIFNLLPGFNTFQMPSYSMECPQPTFNVFNTQITMTSHCEIAEMIKPTMYAVFVVVWTIIALFILLGA